jgi:hypothetical protein
MKTNEFKSLIRQIVIEEVEREVQKQLPKLLFEMLSSKQTPTTIVNETVKPSTIPSKVVKNNVETTKKPIKNYVKNPILNQILNETTPGLPQGDFDSGVPLPHFDKIGNIQESVTPVTHQPSYKMEEMHEEVSTGTDISRLFNKNFKAILDKSKEKGANSGNYSGLVQNW